MHQSGSFQKLSWKQIRNEIKDVNPEITRLIDDIDPNNEYSIYKLECPWGYHLLNEGKPLILNRNNEWVPLGHNSIESKIAEDLSYNISMPLGMVLNNSLELYLNVFDRIVPWVFMPKGTIFGLWVGLSDSKTNPHTGKMSNIIAGSRSSLMLPKISDGISFQRLKKQFNLKCRMPETLTDQWPLLFELSQHQNFAQQWTTTVIYFSKKWVMPQDGIAWKMFKNYLLEYAWEKTEYLRAQVLYDVIFSCALEEKNLKPNPYLTDTVKHLFGISQNHAPGYKVTIDNEALPLDEFQKIFVDIYGLKYQPTIMTPSYLSSDSLGSIYYSLEVPTLLSFSPKSKKNPNKLGDLREIKYIMDLITEYLKKKRVNLNQSEILKGINFEYYHTDYDSYNETLKTSELATIDRNIRANNKKFTAPFCDTSPFLRGCVRITKNTAKK